MPAELLACSPAPLIPTEPYTQAEIAAYIVDLHSAWQDCFEKNARIKALQDHK